MLGTTFAHATKEGAEGLLEAPSHKHGMPLLQNSQHSICFLLSLKRDAAKAEIAQACK
jgi:hypothetical protein